MVAGNTDNMLSVLENYLLDNADSISTQIAADFRRRRVEKGLTREQIADVVRLQIRKVQEMLEPQGFRLEVTPQAIDYLAQEGYDPEFGARPVKRAIQQLVLNDLSKKLLAGEVTNERPIIVDDFGDGLVFRN